MQGRITQPCRPYQERFPTPFFPLLGAFLGLGKLDYECAGIIALEAHFFFVPHKADSVLLGDTSRSVTDKRPATPKLPAARFRAATGWTRPTPRRAPPTPPARRSAPRSGTRSTSARRFAPGTT